MMNSLPADLPLALGAGLSLLAAGIFTGAAIHKLRSFTEFSAFVAGYRLLPVSLVRPASAGIVLLEIGAIAGALGAPAPLAQLPAAALVLYALAMTVNLARGRASIDCGCGGTPMPISATLVLRNLVLAAAFLWAVRLGSPIGLALDRPALFLSATGFALCLGIFYAAFNQLQANRGIHQRLWMGAA